MEAMMDGSTWPIDFPYGTYRDGRVVRYGLTHRRGYIELPPDLDKRLQAASKRVFWRFMTRQLRRMGLPFTVETAWRAFID
jgi:hypothetical protein